MRITYEGVEYLPIQEYAKKYNTEVGLIRQKKNRTKSIPTMIYGDTIFVPADLANNSIRHHNFAKYEEIRPNYIEIDGNVYLSSYYAMQRLGCTRTTLGRRGYERIMIGHSYFYPERGL